MHILHVLKSKQAVFVEFEFGCCKCGNVGRLKAGCGHYDWSECRIIERGSP